MNSTHDHWAPERYQRNASFVPEMARDLIDWLAPARDERILDLGCGDGVLSAEIASRAREVVAVDASPAQVEATRALGIPAHVQDGQHLDAGLLGHFDAVFSNAAIHWMPDQDAVYRSVARVLRSGGRFVAEFGGLGNIEVIRSALHAECCRREVEPDALDPWTFPGLGAATAALERAGFLVHEAVRFVRPTPLPGDLMDWLDTFARPFLQGVPEAEHAAFLEDVRERCAPSLHSRDGWTADYVRLRIRAERPTGSQ